MFGTKRKTVPQLLAVGLNWVTDLEEAAVIAEDEAIVLEAEANLISAQADVIRSDAEEGRAVAANFRTLLKAKS